ncbi:HAD-IIA family hydrolase [Gordonia desulfuricans]|uniref:HAD-IIA family hydrolase n=1 Tax=Gordonia desulfuricans TaxID=89051 RepID=A0A7K3LUX5_9ACTN|nr:HAD-IIA family hydrolase [Gordonia desulfuricans]NDK92095.1 HAD-IIA family hydrolase [Gordonia desulfuricans]
MNDRDRNRGRRPERSSGRPQRSSGRPERTSRPEPRADEPQLPVDVAASDLDGAVRRDLLTLDKATAEIVARHLVMVTQLLDEDPMLALAHARAARRRATRVGVVRETAGIAAYSAGEWQEAISELRAARRITGSAALLPLIADAERGLGRPDRAIEIARSDEGRQLAGEEATEMRIVEAGARMDLGEPQKAIVTLQREDLSPARTGTTAARLFYAYAAALEAAGRADDALTWFMNAASADVEDATDAEFRLMELSGGTPDLDGVESDAADEDVAAAPAADSVVAEPAPASPEPQTPARVVAEPEPAVAEPVAAEPVVSEPVVTKPVAAEPVETKPVAAETADVVVPEPAAEPVREVAAEPVVEAAPEPVRSTRKSRRPPSGSLVAGYDALLLDLDGTVFAGHSPVPNAAETLERLDLPTFFVTNNASRRPDAVAEHLTELGFTATPEQVVTSAQSGARLLAEHLEPGSRALVLGSEGLVQEVREVGIAVTRSADDRPAAVIQGYSPDTGWAELSEAALAIRAGALWIATNVDATLPSERGLLVGNGSLVAAVANATGQEPLVAGKPAAPLMADAIARSGADAPLVIGDRLDTDIQGAHAVGLDSLLVLTGVSTASDLLNAPPEQRPTFVTADLAGLLTPVECARIAPNADWAVRAEKNTITIESAGPKADPTSMLPALAAAVWALADAGAVDLTELIVVGSDESTGAALTALGVVSER